MAGRLDAFLTPKGISQLLGSTILMMACFLLLRHEFEVAVLLQSPKLQLSVLVVRLGCNGGSWSAAPAKVGAALAVLAWHCFLRGSLCGAN